MELHALVCKCCGAPLDADSEVGRVVRCKYCGTSLVLSREERARVFLDQGEHDLDTCRFDEAYAAYLKAAELDAEEPEAYFGMALATFKVQYLKDEAAEPPCLRPVCHEVAEKYIFSDKNYLRALELATEEQKEVYKERAREIERIRREFRALRRSGPAYDCFLCAKISDGAGGTTQDSHEALKIYNHLVKCGYRPFYSEECAASRTGTDYEALILYALHSSPCMLIVCSDEAYLQTKWVKNEYTRFLKMISDEEKERNALAFVYSGTPVERLPGREGRLQGIDLKKPDAYTRILSFVAQNTPAARRRREEEARAMEAELRDLREKVQQIEAERAAAEKRRGDFRIRNGTLYRYEGSESSVSVPEGVTHIGGEAFGGSKTITEVKIPAWVEEIESSAFFGCSNLEYLRVEDGNPRYCSREGILYNRELTEAIYVPRALKGTVNLPQGLYEVRNYLFERCRLLTQVILPDGMKRIGEAAFKDCVSLKRIVIPDSVRTIENDAFAGCVNLTEVTMPRFLAGLLNGKLKDYFGSRYTEIKFDFTIKFKFGG